MVMKRMTSTCYMVGVNGSISIGDQIVIAVWPNSNRQRYSNTRWFQTNRKLAGQSVTILLNEYVDISRGDMLAKPADDF